jgi:hypothetical protein
VIDSCWTHTGPGHSWLLDVYTQYGTDRRIIAFGEGVKLGQVKSPLAKLYVKEELLGQSTCFLNLGVRQPLGLAKLAQDLRDARPRQALNRILYSAFKAAVLGGRAHRLVAHAFDRVAKTLEKRILGHGDVGSDESVAGETTRRQYCEDSDTDRAYMQSFKWSDFSVRSSRREPHCRRVQIRGHPCGDGRDARR